MLPLLLYLASAGPTADDLVPHAAGVALVEVVSVTERDSRPMDGPLSDEIKLRLVRGSGEVPEILAIIKAPGGHPAPPGAVKPPPPKFSLKPGALEKGRRYWVAFSSPYEYRAYPEGVIALWPEDDPKAAGALDAAVKADRWKWHPQYHPKTGLTCGRVVEADKKQWRVRVWKGEKVLWETAIPGTPVDAYYTWGFWDNTGVGYPAEFPKSGHVLVAETIRPLAADNEFGLAAKTYLVTNVFDPETGTRRAALVSDEGPPGVELVRRDYDPTNRLLREERFDWAETGGKAVGAKAENWFRRVYRTFNAATGKATAEDVFRWNDTKSSGERWMKVSPN